MKNLDRLRLQKNFNYLKRPTINQNNKIIIPLKHKIQNKIDELREKQSFQITQPQERTVQSAQEIELERARRYGVKVNVGFDKLLNLKNKTFLLPERNRDGNIVLDPQTGQPKHKYKQFHEIIKNSLYMLDRINYVVQNFNPQNMPIENQNELRLYQEALRNRRMALGTLDSHDIESDRKLKKVIRTFDSDKPPTQFVKTKTVKAQTIHQPIPFVGMETVGLHQKPVIHQTIPFVGMETAKPILMQKTIPFVGMETVGLHQKPVIHQTIPFVGMETAEPILIEYKTPSPILPPVSTSLIEYYSPTQPARTSLIEYYSPTQPVSTSLIEYKTPSPEVPTQSFQEIRNEAFAFFRQFNIPQEEKEEEEIKRRNIEDIPLGEWYKSEEIQDFLESYIRSGYHDPNLTNNEVDDIRNAILSHVVDLDQDDRTMNKDEIKKLVHDNAERITHRKFETLEDFIRGEEKEQERTATPPPLQRDDEEEPEEEHEEEEKAFEPIGQKEEKEEINVSNIPMSDWDTSDVFFEFIKNYLMVKYNNVNWDKEKIDLLISYLIDYIPYDDDVWNDEQTFSENDIKELLDIVIRDENVLEGKKEFIRNIPVSDWNMSDVFIKFIDDYLFIKYNVIWGKEEYDLLIRYLVDYVLSFDEWNKEQTFDKKDIIKFVDHVINNNPAFKEIRKKPPKQKPPPPPKTPSPPPRMIMKEKPPTPTSPPLKPKKRKPKKSQWLEEEKKQEEKKQKEIKVSHIDIEDWDTSDVFFEFIKNYLMVKYNVDWNPERIHLLISRLINIVPHGTFDDTKQTFNEKDIKQFVNHVLIDKNMLMIARMDDLLNESKKRRIKLKEEKKEPPKPKIHKRKYLKDYVISKIEEALVVKKTDKQKAQKMLDDLIDEHDDKHFDKIQELLNTREKIRRKLNELNVSNIDIEDWTTSDVFFEFIENYVRFKQIDWNTKNIHLLIENLVKLVPKTMWGTRSKKDIKKFTDKIIASMLIIFKIEDEIKRGIIAKTEKDREEFKRRLDDLRKKYPDYNDRIDKILDIVKRKKERKQRKLKQKEQKKKAKKEAKKKKTFVDEMKEFKKEIEKEREKQKPKKRESKKSRRHKDVKKDDEKKDPFPSPSPPPPQIPSTDPKKEKEKEKPPKKRESKKSRRHKDSKKEQKQKEQTKEQKEQPKEQKEQKAQSYVPPSWENYARNNAQCAFNEMPLSNTNRQGFEYKYSGSNENRLNAIGLMGGQNRYDSNYRNSITAKGKVNKYVYKLAMAPFNQNKNSFISKRSGTYLAETTIATKIRQGKAMIIIHSERNIELRDLS
jgi:hypothetical protein